MKYIKIEIVDSLPVIKMEYEDVIAFQNLMFCLVSDSGFGLVYKSIEKQLLENNKKDELEVLSALISLVNKESQYLFSKDKPQNKNVINPSSFK